MLFTLLLAGCASSNTAQQSASTVATTSKIAPVSMLTAKSKPPPVQAAPDWRRNRPAWCRLREQQKLAAKTSKQQIGGTTDPYLIAVHDEICRHVPKMQNAGAG